MVRVRHGVVDSRVDGADRGATAVEYAIMLAAIAGVVIATVFAIGPKLLPGFEAVIALWP